LIVEIERAFVYENDLELFTALLIMIREKFLDLKILNWVVE